MQALSCDTHESLAGFPWRAHLLNPCYVVLPVPAWSASTQRALALVQGPPLRSKLSYLAEKYLKRMIQTGSHDSVQDARAAMDLTLLKIRSASHLQSVASTPSPAEPTMWEES